MKVNTRVKPVVFHGGEGERLEMSRSNMGEPYRDGINIRLDTDEERFGAFLELLEVRRMQEFLTEFLGGEQEAKIAQLEIDCAASKRLNTKLMADTINTGAELARCKVVLEKLCDSNTFRIYEECGGPEIMEEIENLLLKE